MKKIITIAMMLTTFACDAKWDGTLRFISGELIPELKPELTETEIGKIEQLQGSDKFHLYTKKMTGFDPNTREISFVGGVVVSGGHEKEYTVVETEMPADIMPRYEGPYRHTILDPDHPFHKMLQRLSQRRIVGGDFVDLLLNSEDLVKIINDLNLRIITYRDDIITYRDDIITYRHDRINMDLPKEQLRELLVQEVQQYADNLYHGILSDITDPIVHYAEMLLQSHALACGTVFPNGEVFHENYRDQSEKILRHFDFVDERGIYNIAKILDLITEQNALDYYECRKFLHVYLHKLYSNDDYLRVTRALLSELEHGKELARYIERMMGESHMQIEQETAYLPNVIDMLKSFNPRAEAPNEIAVPEEGMMTWAMRTIFSCCVSR